MVKATWKHTKQHAIPWQVTHFIGLTNKVSGILKIQHIGFKRLFKIGASGTVEGLQEGLQQMVSNYNTDKPLFQGVKDSF